MNIRPYAATLPVFPAANDGDLIDFARAEGLGLLCLLRLLLAPAPLLLTTHTTATI